MPDSNASLYDKSFQERLAANIVRSPRLLYHLANAKISPGDFDFSTIRAILQATFTIVGITGNEDQPIPQTILMDQLRMMKRAGAILPSEIMPLAKLVEFIYTLEPAPDYYEPFVEKFAGFQRIQKEIQKNSAHDPGAMVMNIQEAYESSRIIRVRGTSSAGTFLRTPEVVSIPTGFDNIDRLMNGGLGRMEYGILCAYTGVGKTTFGLNVGYGAAKAGFKVAFATLELHENKIRERLYSLVGRYDYDRIRHGDPTGVVSRDQIWDEVEAAYLANGRPMAGGGNQRPIMDNFLIWDFSQETCSIATLEDWVRDENRRDPSSPISLLIVDWLLCLDERPGFNANNMSGKDVRHKLQRYSDELSKKLAGKFNMAVWATHQASPDAEGEDKITMKHAAEGKSVGWKCSVFLGIGASDHNRRTNPPMFTVNAAKMRDGRVFTTHLAGYLHQQRFEAVNEQSMQSDSQIAPIENDLALARARQQSMSMSMPPPPPIEAVPA